MLKSPLLWLTLLGAALVTGVACWLSWLLVLEPQNSAMRMAGALKTSFEETMNLSPRISVRNAIVFAQNSPVLQLATAERQATVRHHFANTWLHSTKEFEVEADFTARAGYELREGFAINLPPGGRVAEITLPRAKILSMEMSDLRILRDEDGLWNKMTAQDRERAIRTLRKNARTEFAATDLVGMAAGEAHARIAEIVRQAGAEPLFPQPASTPKP